MPANRNRALSSSSPSRLLSGPLISRSEKFAGGGEGGGGGGEGGG